MFESLFKNSISTITTDKGIIDNLWIEIATTYKQPQRHYHNLSHLDHITTELLGVKGVGDWQTIVFSIAYHDFIYDPFQHDNEEKSAAHAAEVMTQLGLPDHNIIKCRDQILATKKHVISGNIDTNYFTDADLSILGASPDAYKGYSRAIRKEYVHFPDAIYNEGRKKVLQHFLQMPEIYKTRHFKQQYENAARQNMMNEQSIL
jgi:predicted metal-dependent HD superfamily phosphohydrolase